MCEKRTGFTGFTEWLVIRSGISHFDATARIRDWLCFSPLLYPTTDKWLSVHIFESAISADGVEQRSVQCGRDSERTREVRSKGRGDRTERRSFESREADPSSFRLLMYSMSHVASRTGEQTFRLSSPSTDHPLGQPALLLSLFPDLI